MQFLQHYAPYLLIACGVLGALAPTFAAHARSLLSRVSTSRTPLSAPTADLQRDYALSVLTVMESCRRCGCTEGVATAKSLLCFVDQIHAGEVGHA